jgi:hypothetical protein
MYGARKSPGARPNHGKPQQRWIRKHFVCRRFRCILILLKLIYIVDLLGERVQLLLFVPLLQNFLLIKWFRHVIPKAQHPRHHLDPIARGRQDDPRARSQGRDIVEKPNRAHAGHHVIHQYDVDVIGAEDRNGFVSIDSGKDRVAVIAKQLREHVHCVEIIVDDKDGLGRGFSVAHYIVGSP